MMTGSELLRAAILKEIYNHKPSTKALHGQLARTVDHIHHPPGWMKQKAFDGQTWIQLDIHERKYLIRTALYELMRSGSVKRTLRRSVLGRNISRLEVVSVLDMLASDGI